MRLKTILGLLIVLLLVFAYVVLSETGTLAVVLDEKKLHGVVRNAGWLGPAVLIGLMAAAIVMSPVPSAPIALASGMAYGHFWGTVYVVIGAEAGALIAFGIGRLVGYEVLQRWLGERLHSVRIFGSQNGMAAIVFISRLLPFVSFDAVSYAAGLTPLAFWRFGLATLAGIIPMTSCSPISAASCPPAISKKSCPPCCCWEASPCCRSSGGGFGAGSGWEARPEDFQAGTPAFGNLPRQEAT